MASSTTNGKVKSNSIAKKKQNHKKAKTIGSGNVARKSNLTDKVESIADVNESNVKATNNSPLKKKGKKQGKAIVDAAVATEILSNPKIAKAKNKKSKSNIKSKGPVEQGENIEANSFPSKKKEKKQRHKPISNESTVLEKPKKSEEETVETTSPCKTKKKKNAAPKGANEDGINDSNDAKYGKKRKISVAVDEENEQSITSSSSDKKQKKSKTNGEQNSSPKKPKPVETSADGEKSDEAAKDKTPSVSVFVGNLPVNTKRAKILKLFSNFGKVKSIRFRLSNGVKFFKSQSKVTSPNVIAFVDFETLEEAKASLVLNGEKVKENVLRVNLQSNAKSADSFDGKRTVFVGNLKYVVTDQNLHDLFSCCGEIEYARTMQCDKGCNGVGYVCFKKSESIGMALELNNSDLLGRPVRVERYTKKSPGGSKEKKNKKEKPTGAVRRLGKKSNVKAPNKSKQGKETNSKKSFTGMKAKDKQKKGFTKKSKKPLKGPKLLAKKIASRDKATTKAA